MGPQIRAALMTAVIQLTVATLDALNVGRVSTAKIIILFERTVLPYMGFFLPAIIAANVKKVDWVPWSVVERNPA